MILLIVRIPVRIPNRMSSKSCQSVVRVLALTVIRRVCIQPALRMIDRRHVQLLEGPGGTFLGTLLITTRSRIYPASDTSSLSESDSSPASFTYRA